MNIKMKLKIIHTFTLTSGLVLIITAFAKFISASGSAHILKGYDPSLGIQYKHLFLIVGICELFVALTCFFNRHTVTKVILISWLSTMLLVYRISLLFVRWDKPCSCLGTLTGALHIPPQTADTFMKAVLIYLLIGSYVSLFWLWRQNYKVPSEATSLAR
jgi:hypothetical protein